MRAANLVIERLRGLDFAVREDDVRLFGEQIPFVRALAFDPPTRQFAIVAEDTSEEADGWEQRESAWRDLLFAVSGLRRQLSGSRPPALSQPVLIAVAPGEVAGHLRALVEEVVTEYALFTRIDLNILDASAEDRAAIDRGMASLLPLTREAIKNGLTVATQDIEEFWGELESAVADAGERCFTKFDSEVVDQAMTELMRELRTDLERPGETEAMRIPAPISGLELRNFRSFAQEEVAIGPNTIVHGANGSGKTSICEAMEILWSRRTRRIPQGVSAAEYERHLNFEGRQFHLQTSNGALAADSIASDPEAILGRTALPQHRLTEMADGAPDHRFRAFLESSGLELPEFEERLKTQLHSSLELLNRAFAQAGIGRVPAVNRDGVKALDRALQASFASRLSSADRIGAAAAALEKETAGAYEPDIGRLVGDVEQAQKRLLDLDAALAEFAANRRRRRSPLAELEDTVWLLNKVVAQMREDVQPLSLLVRHLQTMADSSAPATADFRPPARPSPIPAGIRARWLAQARGLEADIASLEQGAEEVGEPVWRGRLDAYLEALRAAEARSSRAELEGLVEPERDERVTSRVEEPAPGLLKDASFSKAPLPTEAIIESMIALQNEIVRQAEQMEIIAQAVESHPAAAFAADAPRIESALCRFELRRELMKPNGALTQARAALVGRLLDERLTPVVRELVGGLVRFEWYFKPLQVEVHGRELRMHGLASDDPELDIRMLLNAAERTIVGIAWFLGLHLTQAKEERKVLILDDPASGFDETNRAAFVATLSVLLDLLAPDQFLITTHDEALVAALEAELGRRPDAEDRVRLLRCRRTESGTSEIKSGRLQAGPRPDLEAELEALHFDLAGPSRAKTK